MNHYGNIRKMYSELKDEVEYALPLYDSTTPSLKVNLNNLIGSTIKISFSGIDRNSPNLAASRITDKELSPTSIAIFASFKEGPVENIPIPLTTINLG